MDQTSLDWSPVLMQLLSSLAAQNVACATEAGDQSKTAALFATCSRKLHQSRHSARPGMMVTSRSTNVAAQNVYI